MLEKIITQHMLRAFLNVVLSVTVYSVAFFCTVLSMNSKGRTTIKYVVIQEYSAKPPNNSAYFHILYDYNIYNWTNSSITTYMPGLIASDYHL